MVKGAMWVLAPLVLTGFAALPSGPVHAAGAESERAGQAVLQRPTRRDYEALNLLTSSANAIKRGDAELGLERAREAESMLQRSYRRDRSKYAAFYVTSLQLVARALTELERYEEAERQVTKGLRISRRSLGENNDFTLASWSVYARILNDLDRNAEAEEAALRVLKDGERDRRIPTELRIVALIHQARALREQGRYDEAALPAEEAVRLARARRVRDRATLVEALREQAQTLYAGDRFAETLPVIEEAYALVTESRRSTRTQLASVLGLYGSVLSTLGRPEEALEVGKQALELRRQMHGATSEQLLVAKFNYATQLTAIGRAFEVEPIAEELVRLRQQRFGDRDERTLQSINLYVETLHQLGRAQEADTLSQIALERSREALGDTNETTLYALVNRDVSLHQQQRYAEAVEVSAKVVEAYESLYGADDRRTLVAMLNYAVALQALKRTPEALPVYARALELSQRSHGDNNPTTISVRNRYADTLIKSGQADLAVDLAEDALTSARAVFPAQHREVIFSAGQLAYVYAAKAEPNTKAFDAATLAAESLRSQNAVLGFDARASVQLERDLAGSTVRQDAYFAILADAAWTAKLADPAGADRYFLSAFSAVQEAMESPTSRALAEMAARSQAEQSAGLGSQVRRRQELIDQWQAAQQRLTESLGGSSEAQLMAVEATRAQLASIEQDIAEVDRQLQAASPELLALTRPQPLSVEQAQAELGPDEAAILIRPSSLGTHVIVVTDAGTTWHRAEETAEDIDVMVDILRYDLDPVNGIGPFNREQAYALYTSLIRPVEAALEGKSQLYVAADGVLASLPLGVLVSEAPAGEDDDLAALRGTSWLADKYAITQIPTLQSLALLRRLNRRGSADPAQEVFAGFGAPVLDGPDEPETFASRCGPRGGGNFAGASIRTASRGSMGQGLADVSALKRLCPLPETGPELERIRAVLDAPLNSVRIGSDATEAQVKRRFAQSGSDVIAFATHGLLANEVDGVSEPALVFTPPTVASDQDDGLLTASEVTALALDSEWVILSACNTGAGDGAGAEGLSGLAKAFFFAGARSLLVSHWQVRDDVAARLTARTVELKRREPSLSRADAFQRAMAELRNSAEDPSLAHPSAWAPFTLVGEGR